MAKSAEAPAGSAPSVPTSFTFSPSLAVFKSSLQAHLSAHPVYGAIAVGAFVFNQEGKMLLIQRAAHDSLPLLWEIPGGACEFEDESLLHAVARELWEESALRVKSIDALVGEAIPFTTGTGTYMCKYSFLTQAEGYDVKLDPEEHQAFLWVTEEEAKAGKCGDVEFEYTFVQQRRAVLQAFEMHRAKRSSL
ncbi:NUDIX hydrolase domain-like protein [Hypoxylon sp. FL1284]|nr:NUDIX hydrolase domain-like protein [Hypoxylon sp. FL1284]